MAIKKVPARAIDSSASSANLSIDAGTLYIDSVNNRVGVGTTSPNAKLQVQSGTMLTPLSWASTDVAIFGAAAGSASYIQSWSDSAGGFIFSNETTRAKGYILWNNLTGESRWTNDGVGSLYIRNNGSDRLTIDSSGNVGIGTSSPNILGLNRVLTINSASNQQGIEFAVNGAVKGLIQTNGDTEFIMGSYASIPLVLRTSNTERMRIDSSGNVGIGTTTTGGRLNIGGIAGSSNIDFHIGYGANGDNYYTCGSSGNQIFRSSTTERMRIDSNGNLLVGTTTAYARLNVVNGGGGALATQYTYNYGASNWNHRMLPAGGSGVSGYIGNLTGDLSSFSGAYYYGGGLYNSEGTAAYGIINSSNNNAICFYANSGLTAGGTFTPTERMRIDSSGNLLIGTTSQRDVERLSVVGSSGTGILVQATNAGSNSYSIVFRNAANATVGSCYCTSTSTAYNTSSDYRLKENIQLMQGALAVVQQLNPVTYTWKADGSDGQGFIAHELQSVVPDCVTGEKDAVDEEGNPVYQGVDTSFLVATLTKAIQELNAKVEAQALEIAALKAK